MDVFWNASTGVTLSNNNLTASVANSSYAAKANVGKTKGKYFWEITYVSGGSTNAMVGIINGLASVIAGEFGSNNIRYYYSYTGGKYPGALAYGNIYTFNDVIGVLLDLDNGHLEYYKNGVSQGYAFTNILTMGEVFAAFSSGGSAVGVQCTANFGATDFRFLPKDLPKGTLSYDESKILSITDNIPTKDPVKFRYVSSSNLATPLGNGVSLTPEQLISLLHDGTITKQGNYGAVLFRVPVTSTIVFAVEDDCKVWASSGLYSDSGGPSGKNLLIYKLDEASQTYSLYKTVPTTITEKWYVLCDHLPKGTYRFQCEASYVQFNELYFETVKQEKILFGFDNKAYAIVGEDGAYGTKMTSNNSPAPLVASASSNWSTDYLPWKAFNGTNLDVYDYWATSNRLTTGYIQLDFGILRKINVITLFCRNASGSELNAPKDIDVQASTDGTNFEKIGEIRNQTGWKMNESRTYTINNHRSYRYYRLNVLANNGGADYVGIGEIIFGYKHLKLVELQEATVHNFINYGNQEMNALNNIMIHKEYVLRPQNSLKVQLTRKPLSLTFK